MSERPLWTVLSEVDQRAGELALTLPLLSVSKLHGVVRYKDLFPDRVIRADDLSHYKVVETGQIVLNKMSAATGAVGRAEEQGLVSPDYAVLSPSDDCDSRYLKYLLGSEEFCKNRVEPRLQGIGIGDVSNARTPRVTTMSYLSIVAFLPEVQMQTKIVDYLDRETGEIDAMLSTLDELRETLRLRRVQVIQSAVRSSRSVGIGLMLDVKLGKMLQTKSKSSTDRLQPYLRAAHIQPGGRLDLEIDTKEMYFSERESETLSLRAGDAVIVEGGAGFGRAAYLTEDMPGWGFQNSIIRLRGASADTRYAVYALQAALESGEIAIACNAATFAHFTAEKVESFRIPYHGTDEHRRIADHLDEVTGRIDAMLATIDELKALLVERRAALITDVVTGRKKIPS